MELRIIAAEQADKAVLRRLLELYQHDFSEFDGRDLDGHGEYGYKYLDHYWTEPGRHPFLFTVDARWAGLALVRSGLPNDMAEFFVLRKYRRTGVGRRAAQDLFGRFPGPWMVRQQRSNPTATAFWRSAIPFPYSERETEVEVIQEFNSEREPRRP